MGKDLKGKELGEGLSQLKDGRYCARYTNKYGKRKVLYSRNLKELKQQFNKTKYEEMFYNKEVVDNTMTLDDVYTLWIATKWQTIKPSTAARYEKIYHRYIYVT